jgi:hypothetical protein
LGIEPFQGSAARVAGVDLVVIGEIGEPFEDAEQVLVPRPAQGLHVAGAALRTKRPEPRQLVAAFCRVKALIARTGWRRPQVVLVSGEAGLGKSHITAALEERAQTSQASREELRRLGGRHWVKSQMAP